ncbi:reverse transcriptase domain-containing protein [Tanacetum coccineum]
MVTPVEKRSSNKFCEFHNDKGHSTDECVQLRKQIEELSFAHVKEITFPPLTANKGTEGPLVIEAEIGGHVVYRMRRRAFYESMDEFYDSEVTVTIQRYHWKAWDKRNPSSTIHGSQNAQCATIAATPKDSAKKAEARYENFKVAIHPDFPDQEITIGGTVSTKARTELCTLLKGNLDIFAWQPSDMTGVPRSIAEHRLNIREGYPPVRQKKRGQAPERAKAIQVEVQKLVEAGILREVYYHDWLSNPVMVKKHDGSWRMCVDFTDLNKACPQDCYPLPEIDWKVESLCGYPFKCFLDAYKGYHQIQMAEQDEEKTAFHTSHGVYCYTKMPFGLKNAGATYQRLVDKAFDRQIGRNLEIYVDDLVIKSHTETELLRDIEETFRTLRKINMKLNPKKCTFGATEGMFLGYMISPEGIKPCPDKTEAVLQLPSPRTIKEVQSLNGKLASLNRFLSKSAEKSLPLFKTLKKCIKKSDFHWTPEAEQAFKQLKQHLVKLPMLVAPKPKEELIMYLSASYGAISAVLMTERDTVQTPVYFVSRALQAPELNYTPMEKLVLALVCAAKRLRRYFQAHPIVVITDQPIKQVISRPDVAGRLQKWSIMLGEHNITYRPRTSVKGQILADFLVEKPDDAPPEASVIETPQEQWTLFADGSSCVDGSGVGLILTSPEGTEFTYALRFQFTASNNEAEYEALIAGLWIAVRMGVCNVQVSVDSKLVANQVLRTYISKEENMIKYLEKTKSLVSSFNSFSISQVPRSKNKKADALSKIASTSFAHLANLLHVKMDNPNITMEEYIRFEKEKARRHGKVYNWETATYGKIWDNKDVHDLGSVETEFPAIVFNDTLTSEVALSCEPTVSSLHDEIDFRISFDESDDEDCTVIFEKKLFSYKIISVNNLKTDSENDNDKVNMPLIPSPEPMVGYFDDLDYFKDFKKEFPAIVYSDAQTSKSDLLTEPILNPQHIDEFNLKDETSFSKCDEEKQNVLYFNDLFSFNVIYPDDSKSDEDNDDDKVNIEHSSGDLSFKLLPDVINTDVGAYAHGSNNLLETSHDTSNKFFKIETFVKGLNLIS